MARTKKITDLSARRDRLGVIKLMAQADGYVMVRRPCCLPFVMSFSDWLKLDEAHGRRRDEAEFSAISRHVPHGLPIGHDQT